MDTVSKAVAAFLVFCCGAAVLVLAVSWAIRPAQQAQPCYTPPTYRCPYCNRPLEPVKPETFPTPNVRPGSQTGNLGDKGDKK